MNNLQVFPYVCMDGGWSINDSILAVIWLQLEMEGKVEHLFYDGTVRNVSEWLDFLKQPGTYPAIIADIQKQIPVHICWLKDIRDGVAWAHHSSIGKYRRGAWETALDYWSIFKLRLLLGLTPETNEKAVKMVSKICKFTIVGIIPEVCNMVYEDRRVGGVVSYYLMQQNEEIESWAAAAKVAAQA